MISDASKLGSQKSENLSKHFHNSNLTASKIFSIIFSDHRPFIVIENIYDYFLACKIRALKSQKMGARKN